MGRYIHSMSSRAKRTFLKVNCAALPSDLLESELFGYEVGAFTGATKAKPGKFELSIRERSSWMRLARFHLLCKRSFSRSSGSAVLQAGRPFSDQGRCPDIGGTNIDILASLAAGNYVRIFFTG